MKSRKLELVTLKPLQAKFKTNQRIPVSGTYRVVHSFHRLPQEVPLVRDERFPRCSKCDEEVVFELVTLSRRLKSRYGDIVWNQLLEMLNTDEPNAA